VLFFVFFVDEAGYFVFLLVVVLLRPEEWRDRGGIAVAIANTVANTIPIAYTRGVGMPPPWVAVVPRFLPLPGTCRKRNPSPKPRKIGARVSQRQRHRLRHRPRRSRESPGFGRRGSFFRVPQRGQELENRGGCFPGAVGVRVHGIVHILVDAVAIAIAIVDAVEVEVVAAARAGRGRRRPCPGGRGSRCRRGRDRSCRGSRGRLRLAGACRRVAHTIRSDSRVVVVVLSLFI